MEWDSVARIGGAIVGLLGLGFVKGFSPTLYGVCLHVLTHDARPARSMLAMVVGLSAGATLLMVVFRAVDPHTWTTWLHNEEEALLIHRTLDLAAAAAFGIAAIIVLKLSRRPAHPPRPLPERHERILPMVGVGFVNAVVGGSGIATMYVTGRVLTGLSDNPAWQAVAYFAFLLTLAGPYLAVVWAWPRMPVVATRITHAYTWITQHDFRPLLGVALLATGLIFAALGILTQPQVNTGS